MAPFIPGSPKPRQKDPQKAKHNLIHSSIFPIAAVQQAHQRAHNRSANE